MESCKTTMGRRAVGTWTIGVAGIARAFELLYLGFCSCSTGVSLTNYNQTQIQNNQ